MDGSTRAAAAFQREAKQLAGCLELCARAEALPACLRECRARLLAARAGLTRPAGSGGRP